MGIIYERIKDGLDHLKNGIFWKGRGNYHTTKNTNTLWKMKKAMEVLVGTGSKG